jgi:steroid delta-isomerase
VRVWNAHDLEGLLAHYVEDVSFVSPRAALLTGDATVRGKPALRAYWGAAIARTRSRRFTLERTVWDAHARELVVVYVSQVDERRVRAVEIFRFGADGLVVAGEALYGAEV